jgi:hypothetical protein
MHHHKWTSTGLRSRRTLLPGGVAAGLLTSILLMASIPVWATAKSEAGDPDYAVALAIANRFLHAWQNNDVETGVLLLTDSARRHTSESALRQLLAGSSNPRGFEIAHGKRLRPGRYSFPVVLVERVGDGKASRQRFCDIVIVRAGKDDWAVDKLP